MATITAEQTDIEARINARKVAPLSELIPKSDAWKEARQMGIGGSEAASVVGLGEFQSAFELYLRKTETHPDGRDWEGNEAANWGTRLEPIVAAEHERRTGSRHVRPRHLYQHRSLGWMIGNPDDFVIDAKTGEIGVFEAKTCSYFMGDRWGNEPDEPATYALMQSVHYMELLDLDFADIAVLIAGQDYRQYRIRRDPELSSMLIEYEADFWDRVQRKDPPDPTHLAADKDLLNRLWDPTEPKEILVGDEFVELVRIYNQAKDVVQRAGREKEQAGNQLRLMMGDATDAVDVLGNIVATWRPHNQRRFNQKKFESVSPHLAACYTDSETVRTLLPKKNV